MTGKQTFTLLKHLWRFQVFSLSFRRIELVCFSPRSVSCRKSQKTFIQATALLKLNDGRAVRFSWCYLPCRHWDQQDKKMINLSSFIATVEHTRSKDLSGFWTLSHVQNDFPFVGKMLKSGFIRSLFGENSYLRVSINGDEYRQFKCGSIDLLFHGNLTHRSSFHTKMALRGCIFLEHFLSQSHPMTDQ